jgi:eukaryotic-like serine/threonine-protein kinase
MKIGQTVSHYKILEKLGEGGMGVVYKAHDTRLDRTVALKFLPPHLTKSEEDKQRFIREAKAAAALNHPHICTIHSVDEHGGNQFIVMEYVDGVTLRQRSEVRGQRSEVGGQRSEVRRQMSESPITDTPPLATTIEYAIQIAEALAEAHEKGIVHRDIKPENIMVDAKNRIKVMDFGLAKLKGTMNITKAGSTVGTVAYMSPEQIQGQDVDHRSDIFSFGVVLYELLTRNTPFRGEHEAAMVYSIVNEHHTPPETYVPDLSAELIHLLNTALEKDPEDRYHTVSEIIRELRRVKKHSTAKRKSYVNTQSLTQEQQKNKTSHDSLLPGSQPQSGYFSRKRYILAVTVLLLLIGIYAFYTMYASRFRSPPQYGSYTQITRDPLPAFAPALSPDGRFIAYTKFDGEHIQIFTQRVEGGTPINLTGDSDSDNFSPAFSPDGERIAFQSSRDGGGIFLMGATGESVRRLTDFGYHPSWSPDGNEIVFCTEFVANPNSRVSVSELWIVNVNTGELRKIYDGDAVHPQWSPNGRRIAFWAIPYGEGQRDLYTIPASGGEPEKLTDDVYVNWSPVWSPDGSYLYFSSDRAGAMSLWRVPISQRTGKLRGEMELVPTPAQWSGSLSISGDGSVISYAVYHPNRNIMKLGFDPVTMTVTGDPVPVTRGSKVIAAPEPSPDNQWITYWTPQEGEDIYLLRSDGTDVRRLTNDQYKNRMPRWSYDGNNIIFYSNRGGSYNVWMIHRDGSGLRQLTDFDDRPVFHTNFIPGDRQVVTNSETGAFIVDLDRPLSEREPVHLPPVNEEDVFLMRSVSPDGNWIAGYKRTREIWANTGIVVYSLEDEEYRVLTDYGDPPVFLNDNKHLLFMHRDTLKVINIDTGLQSVVSVFPEEWGVMNLTITQGNTYLYFNYGMDNADIWVMRRQ